MAELADAAVSLADGLRQGAARLRAGGIDEPARDAALLLAHCLGVDRLTVLRRSDEPLSDAQAAAYGDAIARRVAGEPVSRILGRREFWSLDFAISPAVLDPRPDSETLVAAVLRHIGDRTRALQVLDLGTGSGCLLLALLSELPAARGLGVDRSASALAVARANAGALELATRAWFCAGDWATMLAGRFDVVVANPPYIASDEITGLDPEVRLFDPRPALDGGADGLAAYRLIAADLRHRLNPGGFAALECGRGQAAAVAGLVEQAGLRVVEMAVDLAGVPRCVVAAHAANAAN